MRLLVIPLIALAAGCASSPEYVASRSNFDVCRLTMGGPHARNAEFEAARRGLDCRQYYGAINARMAQENAAVHNFIRQINPPPQPIQMPQQINCTTHYVGGVAQTYCR